MRNSVQARAEGESASGSGAVVSEPNKSDVLMLQELREQVDRGIAAKTTGFSVMNGGTHIESDSHRQLILDALYHLWRSGKSIPNDSLYGTFSGLCLPFTDSIPPLSPKYLLPESVYPEKSFPVFPQGPYLSLPNARLGKLITRLPSMTSWRHVFVLTSDDVRDSSSHMLL